MSPLQDLLDQTDARLAPDSAIAALQELERGLVELRGLSPGTWPSAARLAREHPLARRLREDPLTARALGRPRGYPGDAVALDFMYGGLPVTARDSVSRLGRAIFAYTAGWSSPAVAVRQRRNTLALAIDATAATVPGARVLAVGPGHLREAHLSQAVQLGSVGELVALDGDRDALQVVERDYGPLASTFRASLDELAAGACPEGPFDLVYAAGLYEQLDDDRARGATATLLRALGPGGRLLASSFVDGFASQAFLEAFMDWTFQCRDEEGLLALLEAASPAARRRARAWRDATGCLAWLETSRPGRVAPPRRAE